MDRSGERKRASRLPYVGALILMGAVVVAAWVGRDRYKPIMAGVEAPGWSASTLEGEPVSRDDYEGKVVLLNIWATWCPPCREEMPSMQRLYETIDDPDFEVVAISVDADAPGLLGYMGRPGGDVEEFVQEYGLTFDVLLDPSGGSGDAYRVVALPETFLIGRDGIIYRKVAGGTLWDAPQYQELVRRLLES